MKKIIAISCLSLFAYANNDYIPLNEMSKNDKYKYNFLKKEADLKVSEETYKPVQKTNNKPEEIPNIKDIEDSNPEVKNIKTNQKVIDKEFVKDFKKDNILQDTKKQTYTSKNSDFSITPKISYMYVSTNIDKEKLERTHEAIPEIAFRFKEHTLKADYFGVSAKNKDTNIKFDTNWYKIAYLYNYLNANIGIAYNDYRVKGKESDKFAQKFPSLELHFKNTENQLVVEYGGFYGKNDSQVKNAYEYYLNLGYKVFDNDSLVLNAGYKNRIIETNESEKFEYKGPIIGLSTTF